MAAGLQWQTLQLSLAGGVETKEDVRAADARQLDIASDMQFDELKGAQTRKPFGAVLGGGAIFGGGTLANCRVCYDNGGELVVFTDTQLYSWNAKVGAWVLKGDHLAVSVTETPRFATTGDQISCDRAELGGTILIAWQEGGVTTYVGAIDKATGSVLMPPTAVTGTSGRPRLVALATTVLLLVDNGVGSLIARAINPATPATGVASAGVSIATGSFNGLYDAVKIPGQDALVGACRRSPTTSYSVFTVNGSLSLASSVKARTCDGPIAVAVDAVAGSIQVARANAANIQGDLITLSTFVDVFTGQALGTADGTPVNQIAMEYSSVKVGGQYVATLFWSAQETASDSAYETKFNTVSQANVIGTQANFAWWLGIGSRAFEYNGAIYVWLTFASDSQATGTAVSQGVRAQLQNTYFLYRADKFLVAKCTDEVGGGFAVSGPLPGVVNVGGKSFSWCATARRIIPLGGDAHTGYSARSPRDVTFTFDDQAARRVARIGHTLYISGGMLLQYDGVGITELGFEIYPWDIVTASLGGSIPAGTYSYKSTMLWLNAQGEQERSTTAVGAGVTYAAPSTGAIVLLNLIVTRKVPPFRPPAIELWRSLINPSIDAPFYLATSKDPASTGNNRYLANVATTAFASSLNDNLTDDLLGKNEANPENGGVLEYLAPPGARLMAATDTRMFIAGIASDPDRVWYSRLRGDGEIVSFHDSLTIPIPPEGGLITALAILNETLLVFREFAIYAVPGVGFDNLGGGQNYGPAQRISSDVGAVSAEAVAWTPKGILHKTHKGWYVLDRSWMPQYMGGPVTAFDGETPLAVQVVTDQHQVRILTTGHVLVWDYYWALESPGGNWAQWGTWSPWSITDGVHATVWNGAHVYLTAAGPRMQSSTYTSLTYGMDVESSWIKLNDLQGAARIRWLSVLGELRSLDLYLRIRVARDYQYDSGGAPLYFDDVLWQPSPAVIGSALQCRHEVSQQQPEAIKVRITAVAPGAAATFGGNGFAPTPIYALVGASPVPWDPVIQAVALGELGNVIRMSVTCISGDAAVDVRDHLRWDPTLSRWVEATRNVGIVIHCRVGSSPTVAQLEAAITASSQLVTVLVPSPNQTSPIHAAVMVGVTSAATCAGGTFVSPAGEGCKLTGLAFSVGARTTLYRRLTAAQKV